MYSYTYLHVTIIYLLVILSKSFFFVFDLAI